MSATTHFTIKEHTISGSYIREYPRALANNQEDTLQLKIKQYTPKKSPRTSRKVTVIGAHANAFPKELYEPFWDDLYSRCASSGFEIGSIWIADVAWQGGSYALNEDLVGNDPSWYDHSRDLLHMINTFHHEMPRPLIGIGHSMGGCQILNLSLFHPRLFTTLILLDPVISNGNASGKTMAPFYSTYRRDHWPSRAKAAESFRKSPFYQSWDPRVLDLWIQYGLRDCPTATHPETTDPALPAVTLATPKSQEIWTFLRPNYTHQGLNGAPVKDLGTHPDLDPSCDMISPFYRPEIRAMFFRLPNLRPPTYYIQGGESNLGSRESQLSIIPVTGTGVGGSGGVEKGNVGHTLLEGVGHLIPMEVPGKTAELVVDWLGQRLGIWWEEEEKFRREWVEKDKRQKTEIDKEWMDNIGPPPTRKPKL